LVVFLNPFTGFWVNGENPFKVKYLKVPSKPRFAGWSIRYDELGIPHIFANNNHDLYSQVTLQQKTVFGKWVSDALRSRSFDGSCGIKVPRARPFSAKKWVPFMLKILTGMMEDPDWK
jgi:hypothetical protein